MDLNDSSARVRSDVILPLQDALLHCSPAWPLGWRQRLAGFVNFVRPLLKLPLELVSAVRDGDSEACAAAVPYVTGDVLWRFRDVLAWSEMHDRLVFVDATPEQVGIVRPGCAPVSVPLRRAMPIYVAEYVAALVAVILMARCGDQFTVFTDNMGVYHNLSKGRCPRPWLPILLDVFSKRNFSVGYVPSHCNPADVPSRRPCQ